MARIPEKRNSYYYSYSEDVFRYSITTINIVVDSTHVVNLNTKITIGTFIAISTNNMTFTATITRDSIAYWKQCLIINIRPIRGTLAWLTTWRISWSFNRHRIAKKSLPTSLTIETIRVVFTSDALSRCCVTVSRFKRINIVITITFLTWTNKASYSHGVAKVAILTLFTPRSYKLTISNPRFTFYFDMI